ncbi:MAG: PH domain-containing protein [Lachnospiraceae bacterium]|nr:PH domain-containing protein [Lachnospiraceae bacterium]
MSKKIVVEKEEPVWRDRKHFMWFPFSFTTYAIADGRLYQNKGLLTTISDEVLLYRIVDVQLKRTLWHRLFGTGDVILTTRVDKDKDIVLKNIKQSDAVKTMISKMVEEVRNAKNVVGKEFYSMGGPREIMDPEEFDMDDGE